MSDVEKLDAFIPDYLPGYPGARTATNYPIPPEADVARLQRRAGRARASFKEVTI